MKFDYTRAIQSAKIAYLSGALDALGGILDHIKEGKTEFEAIKLVHEAIQKENFS